MQTFNNKYVALTASTPHGSATLSQLVPGTFDGMSPKWDYQQSYATLQNGRMLNSIRVLVSGWELGDTIESISVADLEGRLSEAERANYPEYPFIRTTTDVDASGIFIQSAGFALDRTGNPIFLPSGLYLVVKCKKVQMSAATFFLNIGWFFEE